MENSRTKSMTKNQRLLGSLYKLEKLNNQSCRYYSSRNSPRNTFNNTSPNIMFPIISENDPASPSNIYIHPQTINNSLLHTDSQPKKQVEGQFIKTLKVRSKHKPHNISQQQCNMSSCNTSMHNLKLTHKKSTKHILKNTLKECSKNNNSQNLPINSHEISSPSFLTINMNIQQKYENLQQQYNIANCKIQALTKQNKVYFVKNQQLMKKLKKSECQVQQYMSVLEPYTNNVTLMQQKLQVIHTTFQNIERNKSNENQNKQSDLQKYDKSSLNYELQLLKITQQRQFEQNQQKINRLNQTISQIHLQLKKSQETNAELNRKIQCLNSIINDGAYLKQMKQLFSMSNEELYHYRNQYYQAKKHNQKLQAMIDKLRNKIYLLTSLIGYGVVTSVENNDLSDLEIFRESLSINGGFQEIQTFDTFGMLSIKKNKQAMKLIEKQIKLPAMPSPCLYLPNLLIFYDSQQLQNSLEDSTTIVIKPEFFLMMRAIFDSKYNQFVMYRREVTKFPDYVFGFIDTFRLQNKQKRIQMNPNINPKRSIYSQDNEIAKSSFFIKVFDKKIGSLLEVITFKEFIFKNIPEDEIFYFLLCRNILEKGPQLSNYINCSDAYTFISYDYAHQVILQLIEPYDRQSKVLIINHMSKKKVLKMKKFFIKTSYVLRLLLEVYRKFRQKKAIQLKFIFNESMKSKQRQIIQFTFFFQILRKNFTFLTCSQICLYYRKTVGIFEMCDRKQFFECFNASCLPDIFFKQCLFKDQQLKNKFIYKNNNRSLNYLLQLVSDSVYELGSEELYKQFISLIKLKEIGCEDHIRITAMFTKMMLAKLSSLSDDLDKNQNKGGKKNNLNDVDQLRKNITKTFQSFNNALIDIFNCNLKRRQKYEQKLDAASSKIGRFIRSKVQQFYSEFIEDINKQVH